MSTRAERDAAVDRVADLLTEFWSEHKATCRLDPCPVTEKVASSLQALDGLRKR